MTLQRFVLFNAWPDERILGRTRQILRLQAVPCRLLVVVGVSEHRPEPSGLCALVRVAEERPPHVDAVSVSADDLPSSKIYTWRPWNDCLVMRSRESKARLRRWREQLPKRTAQSFNSEKSLRAVPSASPSTLMNLVQLQRVCIGR
jgi:hypothetical protein